MGYGGKHRFSFRRVLFTNAPLALLYSLIAYFIIGDATPGDLPRYFLIAFTYGFAIGSLAHGIMPYLWTWAMSKPPILARSLAGITLTVIAATGCLIAGGVLVAMGVYRAPQFWQVYRQSLGISALITWTVGGIISTYENMKARLQQTTLELRTQELERERALKLASEARLSSLESRIHPHFLFNTLNSISSLIQEDPARAERLIERMSALLRFSLDCGETGLVPLHQEMKIVGDYLEIEKTRFGARLRFELNIPEGFHYFEVPPLSIQTLVENSVKFAVAPRREGGRIEVTAAKVDGAIEFVVFDDGSGFAPEAILKGHGLETLQARLFTLFGMAASLGMRKTDSGMSVTLSLPQLVQSETI